MMKRRLRSFSRDILKNHKTTIFVLLFLFLYSVTITYAVPPLSPYNPGESLDPNCAPGDTNCSVSVIPDQTGHSGEFLTTDGNTMSWAAVSGGSLLGSTSDLGTETWFGDTTLGTASTLNTVFIGINSGFDATGSAGSNFIGFYAGNNATNSTSSNFIGPDAGNGASNSGSANFIGLNAGFNASNSSGSNFIGDSAGDSATGSNNSNFIGSSAGNSATNADHSIFVGTSAGQGSSSDNSIFLGQQAGRDVVWDRLNAIGYYAGYQATQATGSNFIGEEAGRSATNAYYSNFIGLHAGYGATDSYDANFFGEHAGDSASNAYHSIFMGWYAGYNSDDAKESIFIGREAGNVAPLANNSIFIGKNAGNVENVLDNSGGGTSILIGDDTSTGGFSNSIAIGANAVNTMSDQFVIGSTYTNWQIAGVDYVMPSSAAAGAGYVLTDLNGDGVLSWEPGTGSLTDGSGTTANGNAVDLGGFLSGTTVIGDVGVGGIFYDNDNTVWNNGSGLFAGELSDFVAGDFSVVSADNLGGAFGSQLYSQAYSGATNREAAVVVSSNTSSASVELHVYGSTVTSLNMDESQILISGPASFAGIEYDQDYSANYTDRSLADWGNVWRGFGTTTFTNDVDIDRNGGYLGFQNGGTYSLYMDDTITDLSYTSTIDGHLTMDDTNGINLIDNNSGSYLQIKPSANFGEIYMKNIDTAGERVMYLGPTTASLLADDGTDSTAMYITGTDLTIQGTGSFAGIEYTSDYSANYTNRSLVDKAYVDSMSGWALTGTTTLTGPTTIEIGLNDLLITSSEETGGTISFLLDNTFTVDTSAGGSGNEIFLRTGSTELEMGDSAGQLLITDSRTGPTGIEYAADYSATYSLRSLVDKDYVDTAVSDQRYKENIVPIDNNLSKILALNPVTFKYINSDEPLAGFLAQEVQNIFPDMVVTTNPDKLKIKRDYLEPYIVDAIQELNAKIEDIDDLNKENTFRNAFITWLADANNGIGDLFANRIRTKELCVEDVCVTRDQFLNMVNNSGSASVTPTPSPEPEPTIEEPTPTEETPAEDTTIEESSPVEEPVTEPDSTPVEEVPTEEIQ
jgi:hypothetical protein